MLGGLARGLESLAFAGAIKDSPGGVQLSAAQPLNQWRPVGLGAKRRIGHVQ